VATDARNCLNCATPLPAGAHFCLNCGAPTPTEPGVPPRTMPTGAVEVNRVRRALADRYQIERVLGEGGMATVYLAQDLKHHRKVAVKVMRPELAETLGAERFLREVEIAASLNHPHILPVYDSGSSDGILYYVMPLVEGESLPARLAREKQLPVAEALRLTREVAEALAYAHKRGIIHRDIKPANILISEGHALVSDFGIARVASDSVALTRTGLAIGTPQYMSPEQASGEPNIDGRTDIYALGCVLYEMLAGEPPFTGPTAQAIITRSITEDPRPLTHTRAAIAPAIDSAVMKALAKSPADRHATASDFAAALSDSTEPVRVSSGRFGRWGLLAAVLAIVALGAIGVGMFGGSRDGEVRRVAVLPFENQGGEEDAYFADGIVEELRNRLTGLARFTVIASASADQYRGTTKTATQIASELRVDQLLMGRVRWATGTDGARQFRVTTELVDGRTGEVTWRDNFDGNVRDPFVVQGQIATRVARAMGAALGTTERENLASRPTDNVEAYDLYLRGRAITVGTAGGARDRATMMERAVALDSNFVQAWAYLTAALSNLYATGTRDPAVARRAREAMERTLALAPDSAVTHMVASLYYSNVGRDQDASRREVELAYRLDPNQVGAIREMAAYDLLDGNYQAMFEKLARARELDPLDKSNLAALIRAQIYIGQPAQALTTARELQAMDPTMHTHLTWILAAYLANGEFEGARQALQSMSGSFPTTELVAYLAGYHEMAFLLNNQQRELLFRMSPASFDNDRAWWGQSLATAAWQQGDLVRARAYADSSLEVAWQQIEAAPEDAQLRMLNAVSLAMTGRKNEALREAEIAIADTTGMWPDEISYTVQQYARVLLVVDEKERALDVLEQLTARPYLVNAGYLRTDPTFRSLAGHPRFERLANRGIGVPVD
jgi:TolB-like protein/tRNA A-37 threonylcarbamoyl transferase component Bud32/tetratricopeptide (TPR) repeat protein